MKTYQLVVSERDYMVIMNALGNSLVKDAIDTVLNLRAQKLEQDASPLNGGAECPSK